MAVVTVVEAVLVPLLHANVTPAVEEDAVSVKLVTRQVKLWSGPAFTLGVFRLGVTIAASLAVQLLVGLVT